MTKFLTDPVCVGITVLVVGFIAWMIWEDCRASREQAKELSVLLREVRAHEEANDGSR